MDKTTALIVSISTLISAVTGLLVIIQGFRIKQIQKQTDGINSQLVKVTGEKFLSEGRAQESAAVAKGLTTLGTPLVVAPVSPPAVTTAEDRTTTTVEKTEPVEPKN